MAIVSTTINCKRIKSTENLGPAACPSDNFAMTAGSFVVKDNGGSTTTLNLITSYLTVAATFNESISYTFSITGDSSGAVFKYDGVGTAVAISWYGNSTNGKYFGKNETLSYTLTNLCKSEPLGQGSIYLNSAIGYAGFGLKMINFEDSPAVSAAYYGAPHTIMMPGMPGYVASPQGVNYISFKASGVPLTWYFGGMDLNGFASKFPALGTDPTNVYLNFFAKGQVNSQAQMLITEASHGTSLTRKFLANVTPDTWVLYSVRLSDIGIIDPAAITGFSFNMGASTHKDTSAQVDLDLIIFTIGKPF